MNCSTARERKERAEAASLFPARPRFKPSCVPVSSPVRRQKPSAAARSDLEAMIRTCDSSGIRLMFHENWRFRSWYRALRAEISAGTIGRPIRLRIAHRDTRALREGGYDDQPCFRTMPRLILLEMGCHLVDTARFLIGEVETVSAALGKFGSHLPGWT